MKVKDLRLLANGRVYEVLKVLDDRIITTTGIVLFNGQFEYLPE